MVFSNKILAGGTEIVLLRKDERKDCFSISPKRWSEGPNAIEVISWESENG
jgi:hypothetical protein